MGEASRNRMARGALPLKVEQAARRIHKKVWVGPYVQERGPMHHAGGPFWHGELLRQAEEWEQLARDARLCAAWLPDGEDFFDVPALRKKEVRT